MKTSAPATRRRGSIDRAVGQAACFDERRHDRVLLERAGDVEEAADRRAKSVFMRVANTSASPAAFPAAYVKRMRSGAPNPTHASSCIGVPSLSP